MPSTSTFVHFVGRVRAHPSTRSELRWCTECLGRVPRSHPLGTKHTTPGISTFSVRRKAYRPTAILFGPWTVIHRSVPLHPDKVRALRGGGWGHCRHGTGVSEDGAHRPTTGLGVNLTAPLKRLEVIRLAVQLIASMTGPTPRGVYMNSLLEVKGCQKHPPVRRSWYWGFDQYPLFPKHSQARSFQALSSTSQGWSSELD